MNYQTKQVGLHRGAPRLYFQTRQLDTAGFPVGARYDIETTEDKVILTIVPDGQLKVSGKGETPVIDINSSAALAPFAGQEAVKVEYGQKEIVISRLASEEAAAARLKRLKRGVATCALTLVGLAFGGGILDHSAHAGLVDAGFKADTVLVNEIDADLLEHASVHNPVITDRTIRLAAPMQEVVQDNELMARLPQADILVAGIPCSGASKAGKAKNGITMMEDHPEVGHLVYAYLRLVQQIQPVAGLLENVEDYANSASASIIRSMLRDMGYNTDEVVLNAMDFGAMENRNRWFLLFATKGVQLDFTNLVPPRLPQRTVADILDRHGEHHWGTFDYLKAKAVTDKAAGKGFKMQIVDLASTKVPVLRKGYHKGGSTDPLLQHPTDPDLLRLFSGDEHARIKGVDEALVQGLSNTDKHILLGQSVAPGMVSALARRLGECLKNSGAAGAATTAGYRLDRAVG